MQATFFMKLIKNFFLVQKYTFLNCIIIERGRDDENYGSY